MSETIMNTEFLHSCHDKYDSDVLPKKVPKTFGYLLSTETNWCQLLVRAVYRDFALTRGGYCDRLWIETFEMEGSCNSTMDLQRQSNGQVIALDSTSPLGKGGEACIYRVPQESSRCPVPTGAR